MRTASRHLIPWNLERAAEWRLAFPGRPYPACREQVSHAERLWLADVAPALSELLDPAEAGG